MVYTQFVPPIYGDLGGGYFTKMTRLISQFRTLPFVDYVHTQNADFPPRLFSWNPLCLLVNPPTLFEPLYWYSGCVWTWNIHPFVVVI